MQSMKLKCQELFELSRHIESAGRRTEGQTDRQTDRQMDGRTYRKGDEYRAPAFKCRGLIKLYFFQCKENNSHAS